MSADFTISKLCTYRGSNYYLNKPALVFNLYVAPDGPKIEYYAEPVLAEFPQLKDNLPGSVVDLFAKVLMQVLKMDIDLHLNEYSISEDGAEFVIAVEYHDDYVAEECIYFVQDWFRAMNHGDRFDFEAGFAKLQKLFDRSLYGGPTIYSLIEAGLKRDIPVHYLPEENQFQWGYGKKAVRGRSTTFHVDSIKDTEFTMFKDMCGEFLAMCGFPTPQGVNCFSEDEAVAEAEKLGYPVVVKPVAGHKGQGVTTGIQSENEVRKAYQNIIMLAETSEATFEGALVQQQIYGTDHRLLAVGGKFVAALERVPAYIIGDSRSAIAELIAVDNAREVRADTARSELCKIKIDDDLLDYLTLQNLDIRSVPAEGEHIQLRRVANISAGGVSINVTDKIHPLNVKMVEDIAKFFKLTCLGIDVLAQDISKPWTEGNFGIIEINAGPGVFMHLKPAIGGSVDVPGEIMKYHFPTLDARIPIIVGNKLSLNFCQLLYGKLKAVKPDLEFGSLTEEGIYFNGEYFHKNPDHCQNVKIILRNPKLDFAVFNHTADDVFDFGMFHQGADVVILEDPSPGERILKRDLLKDGYLIEIGESSIVVVQGATEEARYGLAESSNQDQAMVAALEPLLEKIATRHP
ncbi:MAG: acetate--CoA ligase family protein [bacterium]